MTCLWALNCHERTSGEEFVAVLEDVYTVGSRLSAIIGVVGDTPTPRFHDLHPADQGRIGWINAFDLEDAYLMASDVANINRVLLGVLGIFRADPEDKPLFCQHRDFSHRHSQPCTRNSPYRQIGYTHHLPPCISFKGMTPVGLYFGLNRHSLHHQ